MARSIYCFLIALALMIAGGGAAAQEGCFRHTQATVTTDATLRKSIVVASPLDRSAKAGEIMEIMGTLQRLNVCWVQTRRGWLNAAYLQPSEIAVLTKVTRTASTSAPKATLEPCFPHNVATTNGQGAEVRQSQGRASRLVKYLPPGMTIKVKSAARYGGVCWIEIDEGWVWRSYVHHDPSQAGDAVDVGCYGSRRAVITGALNIRQEPRANSAKVGSANRGDVLNVTGSKQGVSYCWLKVENGWMARTRLVSDSFSEASLPKITGSARFRDRIKAAYEYLRWRSPKWYIYATTPRVNEIYPGRGRNTRAHDGGRKIEVAEEHLNMSMLRLASVLVHELCHMHQYEDSVKRQWYSSEREDECYATQYDMVKEVDPQPSVLKWIRETKARYDRYYR